jgi:hypothetical protein
MADTHSPAHHAQTTHAPRGSDTFAAFAGLVIGAIALFLLLGSIVMLTNRHYAAERGAHGAER